MNASELALAIVRGSWTKEDVDVLWNAVKSAHSKRREQDRLEAQATLRVGMLVKLEGISPQRLNGIEGNIVEINRERTRCKIKITRNPDPFATFGEREGELLGGLPLVVCKQTQPQVRTRSRTNVHVSQG